MGLFRKKKEELKPCLICGKMTTGDVCSVEHQDEWIKNKEIENEIKNKKLENNIKNKEIENEIKKSHRKLRKKLRILYQQYNEGKILQVNNNIDNKEYLKSKELE